ncbi:MAG: hypothetical protein ACYST6_10275 [Planctomycetota bacterium]|jgi:hypothetical protein
MTLQTLLNKIPQFFKWLYYERVWSIWELAAAVLIVAALLLLIGRGRRKVKAKKVAKAQAKEGKGWRGT